MEKGIWKKYEKTTRKKNGERASYHDLYDDLKNSGKSWGIAQDIGECIEQLCGVYLRTSGTEPAAGDIYVYYAMENDNLIPILYFKIEEYQSAGKKCNFIEYNGASNGSNGIAIPYLPEVIRKLKEIDAEKNQKDIEELETRYRNHQKLLELQSKIEFTEEELLFLYDMYKRRDVDISLVESKIKNRNVQDDYDHFSEEGKAKLFLSVRGTELADQLRISSKKVMTLIAEKKCIMGLKNASTEILKDKDYIMDLLQTFFKSDPNTIYNEQLNNLPECYQIDSDIISLILYHYGRLTYEISNLLEKSPEGREKLNDPEFAYKLVESFIRGLIRSGEPYYDNHLLWMFSNEILNDIENHIMFGPEPNPSEGWKAGEELKKISYDRLLNDKVKILEYRKK